MWFKRAPKNRRLGREFVLDVKLRSSQVRTKRARMIAVVLGSLFLVVASIFLAWRGTEWALNVLLYENRAFAIQEVEVQTDGVIAPDQVRRWTGVRLGQNLFALDLVGVRRNLELVSMIHSVSLEKILPHTLRLRVVEREPLAQLSIARPRAGGGFEMVPYYLDADAVVIVPLSPAQCSPTAALPANEQLPVILGVSPNEVQPGKSIESKQVRAALELLVAFQRSAMEGVADIKTVEVGTPEVLVIKTGQGSEVTFGLADLDQQLLRWLAIFEAGQKLSKAVATLDLAVTNNIPATWLEASAVPQVPVRLAKPPRNKKKHV